VYLGEGEKRCMYDQEKESGRKIFLASVSLPLSIYPVYVEYLCVVGVLLGEFWLLFLLFSISDI